MVVVEDGTVIDCVKENECVRVIDKGKIQKFFNYTSNLRSSHSILSDTVGHSLWPWAE